MRVEVWVTTLPINIRLCHFFWDILCVSQMSRNIPGNTLNPCSFHFFTPQRFGRDRWKALYAATIYLNAASSSRVMASNTGDIRSRSHIPNLSLSSLVSAGSSFFSSRLDQGASNVELVQQDRAIFSFSFTISRSIRTWTCFENLLQLPELVVASTDDSWFGLFLHNRGPRCEKIKRVDVFQLLVAERPLLFKKYNRGKVRRQH